ncbi:hypothetical protein O181_047721 [Austropuccinia psidii MF-1]|uniref:Uncharacterized protein n=1 Tax=Austropuccinia psidii MF-1 TaxID=1389203 RepID=A0A9Q3DPA8_9BASI|nr:hypothetical protein [Austropuccinia psidii MF-1]
MIHRNILRQFGGDLENAVKSRTTEQYSAADIMSILEEVTNRTRICPSRVNLKTRFNMPWKEFVDKTPKEDSNTIKYRSADESELSALLYDDKESFSSDKEPLGTILCHEVGIILNFESPYPPLLRRPAYPASPKSKEVLELHIKEPVNLGVIRKVCHNEEVEVTTPVIVAWNNEKFRMVGDFRALNNSTVPEGTQYQRSKFPSPK